MKKMFYAVIAGLLVLASCEKEGSGTRQFEGLQWISEEMSGLNLADYSHTDCAPLPEGKLLLDVGADQAGYGYLVWVVTGSNNFYSGGECVLIDEDDYTYDIKTGALYFPSLIGTVKFLAEDKVKIDEGSYVTIFDRSSKNYKMEDAIAPLPATLPEFAITPDKDSGFSGDEIAFTANRTVDQWEFEVVSEDVTTDDLATSITEEGILTLGSYLSTQSSQTLASVQIKVTATSGEEKAEYALWDLAWEPAFFDCTEDGSNCTFATRYHSNTDSADNWRIGNGDFFCIKIWDENEQALSNNEDIVKNLNISFEGSGFEASSHNQDGNHFTYKMQSQVATTMTAVFKYGKREIKIPGITVLDY